MVGKHGFCAAIAALGMVTVAHGAETTPGYFRFPALHGDTVVFTAEGDLWSVPLSGGVARRLTTHPGEESQAAISPDGRHVAFIGAYDSVPEVYVMPLAGGEPRRLSFDTARANVVGWTPAGEVLFSTEGTVGPSWRRVLRAADPDGKTQRELPLADANEASFDADGKTLWFTRFGLHITGDFARDYRGGAMAQMYRYALDGQAEATRIATDLDANLRRPMWWNGKLYAVSDADGHDNLWEMATDGSARRALTHYRDWDVRGAALDRGRIVFQLGADLHVLDVADGSDRVIPITLVSDFEQRRERQLAKPMAFLTDATLSASGDRVVLSTRGRVALAGTGPMRRVDVAIPEHGRARAAVLSNDGQQVFAIVHRDDGNEIWSLPADGSPGGKALTDDGDTQRWRLYPSPDGRFLASDDKSARLWLIDTRNGERRVIDSTSHGGDDAYASVTWSPDSRWLVVSRADTARGANQLLLIDTRSNTRRVLTSDRYDAARASFSPDGRWLYFLSDRNFQVATPSPWGDRNMGPFFDKRTRVYALALQTDSRFPFLPDNELSVVKAKPEASKPDDKNDKKSATPEIVLDGLAERLYEVPVAPGNYRGLAVDNERLYLLAAEASNEIKPRLLTLAIGKEGAQPEVFMTDVQGFSLSDDRKKLLVGKATPEGLGDLLLFDAAAKPPADLSKAVVRLGDWRPRINPVEEWRQMFDDAWRMHRLFAFDAAMRGRDWPAVRARLRPLVDRVTDRAELDDLLSQMSADHGALHSQVRGAEYRADPDTAVPATLGASYETTRDGVRIAHIYRTEAELPSERGPLQQAGVDAREGDVLVAINGAPVRGPGDIAHALYNQVGQQVLLTLRRGSAAPHRTVVTPIPIDRDATLRYGDWVQTTRETVTRVGEGRIGYLHLRAMGAADIATFAREFYANFDREGLIIDVRRNRGGNIDSWIIEKLLRRAWAFWQPPGREPYWNMQQTFRGHLVVLIDQLTYSDGETFAAGIKALKLAPLIGKRTAGAGVWLSDRNRLADNGAARIAEFAQYGVDGTWLIEGHGVSPDIEVDNPPRATYLGGDAQLDAALAYLQKRMQEQPLQQPTPATIPPRGTPAGDPPVATRDPWH